MIAIPSEPSSCVTAALHWRRCTTRIRSIATLWLRPILATGRRRRFDARTNVIGKPSARRPPATPADASRQARRRSGRDTIRRPLYASAFASGNPSAGLELARLYRAGFPKDRSSACGHTAVGDHGSRAAGAADQLRSGSHGGDTRLSSCYPCMRLERKSVRTGASFSTRTSSTS